MEALPPACAGCVMLSVFQPMCGIFSCGSAGVIRSTSPAIQPNPSVISYSRPRSASNCMPTQMPKNGRPFFGLPHQAQPSCHRPRRARAGSRQTRRRRAAQCDRRTPRRCLLPSTAARQRSRMRVTAYSKASRASASRRVASPFLIGSTRQKETSRSFNLGARCANGSSLARPTCSIPTVIWARPCPRSWSGSFVPRSSGRSPRSCADAEDSAELNSDCAGPCSMRLSARIGRRTRK